MKRTLPWEALAVKLVVTPLLTVLLTVMFMLSCAPRPAVAGWGSGGCAAPAMVMAPAPAPTYEWVLGKNGDQIHLMYAGRQLGTWRTDDGEYYAYDGKGWTPATAPAPALPIRFLKDGREVRISVLGASSKPKQPKAPVVDAPAPRCCDCPKCECPPPCDCGLPVAFEKVTTTDGQEVLTGVDRSKLSDRERCTINGHEVRCSEAFVAMGGSGGTLVDDSKNLFLAFVGSKEECAAGVAKLPQAIKDHYLVVENRPDDAMVKDRDGQKAFLLPGITVVARSGEQMHHQASMTDMDSLAGAIRKVDPDFEPDKTPDRSKPDQPASPSMPQLGGMMPACCVVATLLILAALLKGKK